MVRKRASQDMRFMNLSGLEQYQLAPNHHQDSSNGMIVRWITEFYNGKGTIREPLSATQRNRRFWAVGTIQLRTRTALGLAITPSNEMLPAKCNLIVSAVGTTR